MAAGIAVRPYSLGEFLSDAGGLLREAA